MKLRKNTVSQWSPVFLGSIELLKDRLTKVWSRVVEDPKLTVFLSNTYETSKAIDLFRERTKDEPFDLPVLIVIPARWERRTEGYNAFALQKTGVSMGRINGDRNEIRERLFPVTVGFGVRFVCKNVDEAQMFANLWVRQDLATRMDLVENTTGRRLNVRMNFDPELEMPEPEFGGDEKGDLIKVETSVILHTFAGEQEINTLVQTINIEYREPMPDGFKLLDEAEIRVEPGTN